MLRSRGPARPRRRWRAALLAAAVLAALFVVDQLGVRRVSGLDYPVTDPLGSQQAAWVAKLASPSWGGRRPGTPGHDEAAAWLAAELARVGVGPLPSAATHVLPFPARPGLGGTANVVGWLPATDPADASRPAIVLGAHYDHIGALEEGVLLGADDNASSVAVLLGALPALQARARKSPVAVVFFDTEELPYFGRPDQGSRVLALRPPAELSPPSSRVRLAVVLDLVGGVVWRPAADTLFASGAEKAPGLGSIVDGVREPGLSIRRLGIHMVENIPGRQPSPVSDYDVFRDLGVPFLFLSTGRTPRYHRPADLPETLHYDRMARTSRWIASLVEAVDASPHALRFDARGEDYAADLVTATWFTKVALRPWSTVPGTGPLSWIQLARDSARLDALAGRDQVTEEGALTLERASFRVQCLIYAYPACFTL